MDTIVEIRLMLSQRSVGTPKRKPQSAGTVNPVALTGIICAVILAVLVPLFFVVQKFAN